MNICVFGSSSEQIDKIYLESAEHLGKKIAEKGYNLVFGAGKYGVMGASARGAYSAGGHTIGVTPDFFIDVGVVFDKCSELIVTDTMRERKGIMEDKADAFVICAGGMGTFEEFFEVLTLKQLNRHKTKGAVIPDLRLMPLACIPFSNTNQYTNTVTIGWTKAQIIPRQDPANLGLKSFFDKSHINFRLLIISFSILACFISVGMLFL